MWEDLESCETSLMMYVIYFPVRKSSGYVQPWTVTSLICCSSSSLNNPPSVFLEGKSCNQVLIPEAQTRWLKLKSLHLFSLSFSLLFSLSVCLLFLLLLFSLFLFSFALSLIILSSPSLHLVVGGVWCQETREIDLEPRVKVYLKARGLFSQLHTERGGEGVEMGRKGMRREKGEIERW